MKKFRIDKVIHRYLKNKSTLKEHRFITSYLRYLEKGFKSPEASAIEKSQIKEEIKHRLWSEIEKREKKRKSRKIYGYSAAAASVLLALAVGYSSFKNTTIEATSLLANESASVSYNPIKNSALLVLEDGSIIDLNNEKDGVLREQENSVVSKVESGLLDYHLQNQEEIKVSIPKINTIIVPKGGTYRVNLADGSKVWLNSDTKLIFPVEFADNERRVELIGEAYFEIVENKTKPFIVNTREAEIQVLGTHFNVNAYEDESSLKTTLIEGKVRVVNDTEKIVLKPGEQVDVKKGRSFIKRNVSNEKALAWKSGYFYFDNHSIGEIMRTLARTYDVDVIFKGDFKEKKYGGKIAINRTLDSVLKIIELTGSVSFKKEGRRLFVMN